MTTKEIKEHIFDLSSFCAGQEVRLDAEDITILKEAFKGLSKLERIEQIRQDWWDEKIAGIDALSKICEVINHE